MSLYTRILGIDDPKLQVHALMAALGEFERGKMTGAEIEAAFGLSPSEGAEAATLEGRVLYPQESVSIGGRIVLTNVGVAYDSTPESLGLGICAVQLAGITQVTFGVAVNKIGSGTQSWQLWNETDGAEVGVIDDAGATGVKVLQTTLNFSPALNAGIKVVRVRAKSTTAADDPIFLGATMLIRRIEKLTSVELHEILLLGEGNFKYGTEAALKARLGV
jgi:hypothetical protein